MLVFNSCANVPKSKDIYITPLCNLPLQAKNTSVNRYNNIKSNFTDFCFQCLFSMLSYWGRKTYICVGKLTIIGSDNGPYLDQCWNMVNLTLGNKFQWNFNRNSNIFIQENAIKNVVCEMAFILSRPQCVKKARAFIRMTNNSNTAID